MIGMVDGTPGPVRLVELEPRIWSNITDTLPEDHPLAWTTVYCQACGDTVHGTPNECMTTWVETGKGAFCIECFVVAIREVVPARELVYDGRPWHQPAATYPILENGDGWALTVDYAQVSAYRAGQDAALSDVVAYRYTSGAGVLDLDPADVTIVRRAVRVTEPGSAPVGYSAVPDAAPGN